jgi:type I restriction enzyme S subunit
MATTIEKIPTGYKQTEVGVIPVDWDIKNIEDLTPQGKKYGIVDGPFGSNLKTEHYRKSGIPIITSGYVTEGRFIADKYIYVDQEKFKQEKRSAVRGGDIVMAKIGARCGASSILPKYHIESILSGNALKITIDENRFSTFYVWQILWNLYLKGDLEFLRTTGAQPAISMANLKKYKILVPSDKSEQVAIATTLSDTDVMFKKLEKLIEKKKNIKQGAMQELLKPKDGWEVKELGQECELITKGTTPTSVSRDFQNSGINFIKIESLTENGKIIKDKVAFIDTYTHNLLKRSQLKLGDVLFSIAGALGRVAIVSDEILPANTNQALAIIRLKKESEIDLKYLSFYLNSKKIQTHIFIINVQGAQANLSLQNISALPITYPLKTEQIRIAQILSDMDAEIEKIESQLAKYQNIKQGMMQTLLTGKIRLI